MAKLKIFDDTAPVPGTLSKQGYINVATNLIADIDNFTNNSTTDQARADLLQGYAGLNHTVYQRTRADPSVPGDTEDDVAIDSSNCKVKVEFDERKKGSGNFGKHNIVLPKLEPGDSLMSTGYLSGYVQAIHDLHGTGTAPEVENACKFLFGLMLVGRCR